MFLLITTFSVASYLLSRRTTHQKERIKHSFPNHQWLQVCEWILWSESCMDEVPRNVFLSFIFPHLARWTQGFICESKYFTTSFPVIRMSLLGTGVGFLFEVLIHEPFQMPAVWFCELFSLSSLLLFLPSRNTKILPTTDAARTFCITQNHRRFR